MTDSVQSLLNLHMSGHAFGIAALFTFVLAYMLVISEEVTELRKSKPVVLAAGIIWIFVAMAAKSKGLSNEMMLTVKHNILDYAELFLFLLVAMTYINTIEERNVFVALKCWLVNKQLSYRKLFWLTGGIAFFLSPIADNMTTAIAMCAIILAVGENSPKFVTVGCINVVVAANAGGAFSPFGDITTLMVWQKDILPFHTFFKLFVPCVVNYLVPAFFMQFAVPNRTPPKHDEPIKVLPGGYIIVGLFLLTIATTVFFEHTLSLPPAIGMMTGLAYLEIFGYYLKRKRYPSNLPGAYSIPFDIFKKLHRIEWDTLLFFYGVILCVGGLSAFGYLEFASNALYNDLGANLPAAQQATPANIIIGVLSAIVDNIPLMFAVLTMQPQMSEGQWLLITLTAGVGGSILSIGSAAGVALMGQSKGKYTFMGHLKWSWAIMLGYAAAILVHLLFNHSLFVSN